MSITCIAFYYLPSTVEDNVIKSTIDMHADALVTFMVKKRITRINKLSALVSLFSHTILRWRKYSPPNITVDTKAIEIGNIGIRRLNELNDFGIWELPGNFLIAGGFENLIALPILEADHAKQPFFPTTSFIIMGYPATKNANIDFRSDGRRDRALFGGVLHGYDYPKETNEILFQYHKRNIMPKKWSSHMTEAPHLNGMSG